MKLMKYLLSGSLVALSCGAFAAETTSTASKPNIVFIFADDLDYADISFYGGKKTETPNIDSIAKNGIEFPQAYVTCPVCGPSRVGFLTGKYQDRIGYVTNHGPKIPENFGLPTDQVLIPEMLEPAGYHTGMIGKWHLGFKPDMVPNAQGFDYFFGHLHGSHDYNPGVEEPGPIMRNREVVKTTKYLTTELGDEAAKFIRESTQPYFLYVPFNAVHGPLQAPKETIAKFSNIKNPRDRTMAAMLYELDKSVGDILKAVREKGEEENTIIIFTNDNGGVNGQLPESNGVYRGGKGDVYEGGIRVPLFVQWKGTLPAGTKYEKPVSLLDMAPTFLDVAHTTTTENLDGVDLMPYITGKNQSAPHDELFFRFVDAYNPGAVRKGDWKAVKPQDDKPWELYNLANDPGETKNLANQKPDILKQLAVDYDAWNSKNPEPMWLDIRIINQRKALGLIEDGSKARVKPDPNAAKAKDEPGQKKGPKGKGGKKHKAAEDHSE